MIRKMLQKIYLALIFIILYAPIVTLIILSFNQSKTRAKWGGFTLKWYKDLLKNEQIMSAFYTTLIIAFVSAAVATVIGTAASHCHSEHETEMEDFLYGTYQYPYDECRDRYGCISDAAFYCFSYDAWFRHNTDRPYYI